MTLSDCVLELDSYPNTKRGLERHGCPCGLEHSSCLVRTSQNPGGGRAGNVARSPAGRHAGAPRLARRARRGVAWAGVILSSGFTPLHPMRFIFNTGLTYQNRQLLLVSSGSSRRSPHPAPSGLKTCIQTPAPVRPPRCPRRTRTDSACRLRGGPGEFRVDDAAAESAARNGRLMICQPPLSESLPPLWP